MIKHRQTLQKHGVTNGGTETVEDLLYFDPSSKESINRSRGIERGPYCVTQGARTTREITAETDGRKSIAIETHRVANTSALPDSYRCLLDT